MAQTLVCPPKITRENFPNDRDYTLQSLVEQLALMELHIRDGSWRLCTCNPEKHLPSVSGLSSEGFGFAVSDDERHFMECVMSQARIFKAKIKSGEYKTQEDMNQIRNWARRARHQIEAQDWKGEKPLEEQMNYIPDSVQSLVDELEALETENPLSLTEIEEDAAWRMVRHLSDKYNVPPPREIKFTEACNPMLPTAVHIQRDAVDLLSNDVTPRPDLDVLVFCRGGVTAFAVAHEFKHYFDHVKGGLMADEGKANEFAIQETRNMLYTTVAENKGLIREQRNRLTGKGMAIDRKKGLAVLVGLGTAKVVDMYTPQLEGALGAYATMGKVAIGAGLMWAGLTRKVKGVVGDVVTFAGGALLINELFKFLPGVTPAARAVVAAPIGAPIAIPGAPGRAVITAASPYQRMWQTPTRLTGGYPQVAQVDSKWIQIRV